MNQARLSEVIETMAQAIAVFEGWHPAGSQNFPKGSRSWRNNNPGNLRAPDGPDADSLPDSDVWPGQTGVDAQGYAIFKDALAGYEALHFQLTLAFTDKSKVYRSSMSLVDFFSKFAPSSDGNKPLEYARFVARELGAGAGTTLKELLEMKPKPGGNQCSIKNS